MPDNNHMVVDFGPPPCYVSCMTSGRTEPKARTEPGVVDRLLADRREKREARQLPPELRGRKLPRVPRAMHADHPLMRVLADWLRDPPTPDDGSKKRTYTARTIENYLDVARLGVHFGDLTYPIMAARTPSRHANVMKVYRIIDSVARLVRRHSPDADVDAALGIRISDLLERAREVPEPSGGSASRVRMSDDEWVRLVAAADRLPSPRREAILVLFKSGLRINEWFQLDRKTVRETGAGAKVIIAEKGDWRRVWSAGAPLRPALLSLAAAPRWQIVRDLFGKDYQQAYARVRRVVDDLALEAGTGSYGIHKFRGAFAVRARRGSSLDAVQELLGHRVITTTKIYVEHAPPEEVQAASDRAAESGPISADK